MANTPSPNPSRKGGLPEKPEDKAVDTAAKAGGKVAGEAGEDATKAAVAVGAAATGKWDTAIKNGLDVLKKRWLLIYALIAWDLSLKITIFIVVVLAVFSPILWVGSGLGSLPGAEYITNSISSSLINGGMGNSSLQNLAGEKYICPLKDTPEWSKQSLIKKEGDCYKSNLEKAEQETGVPWEIIATVDYKITADNSTPEAQKNPLEGSKTRLFEIGNAIQDANVRRNDKGEPYLSKDGQTKKTISADRKKEDREVLYGMGGTEQILRNYHCLNVKKASPEWCFSPRFTAERNDFYKKDDWLWGGFKDHGEALSVMGWRKNQIDGFGKKCTFKEFMKAPGAPDSTGGIGTPGTRDAKNIPILNNFKQGNWCGTAPWGGDYTTFDGGCCTMGDNGCGITSAAIIASWYGCAIDPGTLNKAMNDAGSTSPFEMAASMCGLSQRQIPGAQGVLDFFNSTHEPMVINVNQTMCGHIVGHFVAVAGFDGVNYTVYDPGCCGDLFTVPKDTFEGYMAGSVGTNTSFYKP